MVGERLACSELGFSRICPSSKDAYALSYMPEG